MPVAFMISYQHLTATGTDNINCIKKAIHGFGKHGFGKEISKEGFFLLQNFMMKTVIASPIGMDMSTKHRSKNEYLSCDWSPSILPKARK